MSYPDTITITRVTAQTLTTDGDGDVILGTGETTTTLYSGRGDWQDGLSSLDIDRLGDASEEVAGVVYLPRDYDATMDAIAEGDRITVPDGTGTIYGIRKMSGKIYVKL